MTWNPDLLLEDFHRVAGMAGVSLALDAIAIERCPAPHVPPKTLPPGTMAVYVFSFGPHVLKVGKVGPNSAARYTAQHYNAGSAKSTLAASLIKHGERIGVAGLNETNVPGWIREHTDRVNFILDASSVSTSSTSSRHFCSAASGLSSRDLPANGSIARANRHERGHPRTNGGRVPAAQRVLHPAQHQVSTCRRSCGVRHPPGCRTSVRSERRPMRGLRYASKSLASHVRRPRRSRLRPEDTNDGQPGRPAGWNIGCCG